MSFARIAVPALLVAALGVAAWQLRQTQNDTPANQAWGNVDARHVSLAFEGSGRIAELGPEEGERVRKGDILGRLDTESLEIEKRRLTANLAALEAQAAMAREGYRTEDIEVAERNAESLKAQLASAERTYARQKHLFESQATSRQALDDARYAAESLKRQLGLVREGDPAVVLTDTTAPVPAVIAAVSDTAEFTPKTVQTEDLRTVLVYEVKLTLEDPDNRLRLGQPVTVRFGDAASASAKP